MILERLKTETSAEHDRVEALAASDRIMNGSFTPGEYNELILRNYILHAVFEPLLEEAIERHSMSDLQYNDRQKLSFIKQDIEELGLSVPDVTVAPSVVLDTPNQVLGCLYVIEGSTLGGAVIRRRLSSLPEFAGLPFNFYGCYGERTGPMWNSFRTAITSRVQTPEQEQEAVDAAIGTFGDVARCFSVDVSSEASAQ